LALVVLVESVMPEDMLPDEVASVLVMAEPEVTEVESAGAGVTTGAGAGGGVSSFLPQAVSDTAAKSEATSNDLFMFSSLLSGK
jgi:hypothetical protein